jgi:hypothetical protein
MLPNVWTVEQFKKESSKVFSRRSPELQAVDLALNLAHAANLSTEAGTNALLKVLETISTWKTRKIQQGKASGRAQAVDKLLEQLAKVAEDQYKRKINDPRTIVQINFQKLAQAAPKQPAVAARGPAVPQQAAAAAFKNVQRTPSQDRLFDVLAQAMLDQRKKAMAYDDEDLFDDLDAAQQGRLAARWTLSVPTEVKDVPAARAEALRVLAAMLGNDISVIKNLLENQVEVVVIPRDKGMTVLGQFASIKGKQTFDGRSWDEVRGVGNVTASAPMGPHKPAGKTGKGPGAIVAIDTSKAKIYTAVTEENLLGGPTTVPGAGCYSTGYSTTSHEFAHSVHAYGLSNADRTIIATAYKARLAGPESAQWVDGPRKVGANSCYASMTVFEYFAQLSNAWLGVNKGNDPYTGRPRNNGKQWIVDNEPKAMVELLERVYGQRALQDLNPAVILKS